MPDDRGAEARIGRPPRGKREMIPLMPTETVVGGLEMVVCFVTTLVVFVHCLLCMRA